MASNCFLSSLINPMISYTTIINHKRRKKSIYSSHLLLSSCLLVIQASYLLRMGILPVKAKCIAPCPQCWRPNFYIGLNYNNDYRSWRIIYYLMKDNMRMSRYMRNENEHQLHGGIKVTTLVLLELHSKENFEVKNQFFFKIFF